MFNMFITVPTRTSAAIESLQVDLLSQRVIVEFKNGYAYEYGNVSKRAIANVLFNPDVSLGFWVNNNCVNAERTNAFSFERSDLSSPQLPAFV